MQQASPEVSLRDVTPDNFEEIIHLKVREDQQDFVSSNVYSLAESRVFPERVPLAIYAGKTPVGFAMYTYWADRCQFWIFRLMVAAEHQGRGYGRAAMKLVLERMRALPGCSQIFISYDPENDPARKLYASLGFVITGEVARLDLPAQP